MQVLQNLKLYFSLIQRVPLQHYIFFIIIQQYQNLSKIPIRANSKQQIKYCNKLSDLHLPISIRLLGSNCRVGNKQMILN